MKSYEIYDDKTKQVLLCVLYFAITFASLFTAVLFFTNVIITIICMTTCWFTITALGRNILRIFKHKPICTMQSDGISIYTLPGRMRHMNWNDIKKASYKMTSSHIQLFLKGEHIDHISGMYCIQISYPFQKSELSSCIQNVERCFSHYNTTLEQISTDGKELQHV